MMNADAEARRSWGLDNNSDKFYFDKLRDAFPVFSIHGGREEIFLRKRTV